MVDIICALCGKKQQTEVVFPATFHEKDISPQTFSARRKPDRVHYQINKCGRCGLVFSSPILKLAKIRKLYEESSCTYVEQIPYLARTYLALFMRARSNLGDLSDVGHLRILEVGCGNGFFLSALMERGYGNVFGVEPSKKMVADAAGNLQKRIIADVFKKGQFSKASFDVVCTFHTLDHVINVNEFMREVAVLLKTGGIFLAVVHDTDGLSVKLLGERSPIFDIEHVCLFNKETLALLCKKFGFTGIEVYDVTNTYSLSYWVRILGLPQRLLGPLGKIPISIRAGNIAVVARAS